MTSLSCCWRSDGLMNDMMPRTSSSSIGVCGFCLFQKFTKPSSPLRMASFCLAASKMLDTIAADPPMNEANRPPMPSWTASSQIFSVDLASFSNPEPTPSMPSVTVPTPRPLTVWTAALRTVEPGTVPACLAMVPSSSMPFITESMILLAEFAARPTFFASLALLPAALSTTWDDVRPLRRP